MMYLFYFHNAIFRFKYAQKLFEKDRYVLEYMSQYEDRKISFVRQQCFLNAQNTCAMFHIDMHV